MKNIDLYPARMAIENLGFFNMPTVTRGIRLLWSSQRTPETRNCCVVLVGPLEFSIPALLVVHFAFKR